MAGSQRVGATQHAYAELLLLLHPFTTTAGPLPEWPSAGGLNVGMLPGNQGICGEARLLRTGRPLPLLPCGRCAHASACTHSQVPATPNYGLQDAPPLPPCPPPGPPRPAPAPAAAPLVASAPAFAAPQALPAPPPVSSVANSGSGPPSAAIVGGVAGAVFAGEAAAVGGWPETAPWRPLPLTIRLIAPPPSIGGRPGGRVAGQAAAAAAREAASPGAGRRRLDCSAGSQLRLACRLQAAAQLGAGCVGRHVCGVEWR